MTGDYILKTNHAEQNLVWFIRNSLWVIEKVFVCLAWFFVEKNLKPDLTLPSNVQLLHQFSRPQILLKHQQQSYKL